MMTPWTDRAGRFSPLKAAALTAILIPAALLIVSAASGTLGPRPITEAIHETGDWAIRFLVASLAVTPLRRIGQWPKLILVRRMLGLAAFFYACAHLLLYMLDQKWNFVTVASEIALRFYLTIGFTALLGLSALAATSTDAAIKRMGRNWSRLHKVVYAIGILAAFHYFIQTKADVFQATLIAGLFVLLMVYRLAQWRGLALSSPVVLAALALVGGVATAALEFAWYGLATGIPPLRVLEANLHFAFQIRPAWWVAAAGMGVALLAFVRPWFGVPEKQLRSRRKPARAAA